MFSWILITIFAHLLNAVVLIIDKHLVSNTVLRPVAYTFYSGIFQVGFLLLIPIVGFTFPETKYLIIGVLNGALFILALLVFYKALKLGETSRIVPVVGAIVPIFTVFLAVLILGEFLTIKQFFAFIFFVVGGFLLSSKLNNGKLFMIKGFLLAIIAGFLFALYYTLVKYLYLHISFSDGFFLFQSGGFLGATTLLLSKQNRKEIFSTSQTIKKKMAYLFVLNKLFATFAAVLIFYAISIEESSIAIINSLQASQYVFLLIFALILSQKMPDLYNEQIGRKVIIKKLLAICLIGVGLVLLVG